MAKRASFWPPEQAGVDDAELVGEPDAEPSMSPSLEPPTVDVTEADDPLASVGKRKPTMTDVARIAGVSQTSVSLILNRTINARISGATRERVIEVAREIGYSLPGVRRPYFNATSRKVIAYMVDEISTSPHAVVSFDGARDAGWEAGFLVAAHVTRSNPELEAMTIESIRRDPQRDRRYLFDDFHPAGLASAGVVQPADGSAELPQRRPSRPRDRARRSRGRLHGDAVSAVQGPSAHWLHQRRAVDGGVGGSFEGLSPGARNRRHRLRSRPCSAAETGCRCRAISLRWRSSRRRTRRRRSSARTI